MMAGGSVWRPSGRRPGGGAHKQRHLVPQHGAAGPRTVADAASAVIGHEASVSKPGSRAGPVFPVTVQCQTAILSFWGVFFFPLKSASSRKQHRRGPSGSQAGGSGQGQGVSDIQRGTLEGERQSQEQAGRTGEREGLFGLCGGHN